MYAWLCFCMAIATIDKSIQQSHWKNFL